MEETWATLCVQGEQHTRREESLARPFGSLLCAMLCLLFCIPNIYASYLNTKWDNRSKYMHLPVTKNLLWSPNNNRSFTRIFTQTDCGVPIFKVCVCPCKVRFWLPWMEGRGEVLSSVPEAGPLNLRWFLTIVQKANRKLSCGCLDLWNANRVSAWVRGLLACSWMFVRADA
jgi:hypothetical protein